MAASGDSDTDFARRRNQVTERDKLICHTVLSKRDIKRKGIKIVEAGSHQVEPTIGQLAPPPPSPPDRLGGYDGDNSPEVTGTSRASSLSSNDGRTATNVSIEHLPVQEVTRKAKLYDSEDSNDEPYTAEEQHSAMQNHGRLVVPPSRSRTQRKLSTLEPEASVTAFDRRLPDTRGMNSVDAMKECVCWCIANDPKLGTPLKHLHEFLIGLGMPSEDVVSTIGRTRGIYIGADGGGALLSSRVRKYLAMWKPQGDEEYIIKPFWKRLEDSQLRPLAWRAQQQFGASLPSAKSFKRRSHSAINASTRQRIALPVPSDSGCPASETAEDDVPFPMHTTPTTQESPEQFYGTYDCKKMVIPRSK